LNPTQLSGAGIPQCDTNIRRLRALLLLAVDPCHEAFATPQLDIIAINELICPNRGICIVIAYEGSRTPDVPIFFHYIGAVLCHSEDILFWPSQFAIKPSHRVRLHRVGCQQPCLGTVTLTAPEGTVLEAVRRILYAEGQHPRLAREATRALDRQEFWIGLSHGTLAED
jgi:hypothetical protein